MIGGTLWISVEFPLFSDARKGAMRRATQFRVTVDFKLPQVSPQLSNRL